MVELSRERIEELLSEETAKKEDTDTILRCIYTRYMRLYERYFADMDALNDEVIAGLRSYHEETRSLVKYYYMDIPQDVCDGIREFEKQYSDRLLGSKWHDFLFGAYKEFREKNKDGGRREDSGKTAFMKQALADFYSAMDYVFREGFGTGSQLARNVGEGIMGLLFGKDKK